MLQRWMVSHAICLQTRHSRRLCSKIVQQDLEQGQHRNTTKNWDYFTTAYFHQPEELQAEVASAGFRRQAVFGLEGPGWILSDFDARWTDPRKREDLLRVARALEREASIVGLSAHLLAVGTKDAVGVGGIT
jgi:hypothetical protein